MNFFVLTQPEIGSEADRRARTEAFKSRMVNRGPAPRCPECDRLISTLTWLPPFQVELVAWGHYGDVLLSPGCQLLVSHRFRDSYEKSGLNGIAGFEPVDIVKVKRRRKLQGAPPYFKVELARSQAAIDDKASESEWLGDPDLCPICRLAKNDVTFLRNRRTIIEAGTWSGEDIFIPRGSGDFLVTLHFKEFCENNDIKNAVFVPAESFGHDYYPSPAKLLKPVLGRWEDKRETQAERQIAYRTLAHWLYGDEAVPTWDFDPDEQIDISIIDEARRRIQTELEDKS